MFAEVDETCAQGATSEKAAGEKRTPARYLEHVTVTTGEAWRTAREAVTDEMIHLLKGMLDSARPYDVVTGPIKAYVNEIPHAPGYTLIFGAEHGVFVGTVWCHEFPLVTFVVTDQVQDRSSKMSWRYLCESGDLKAQANKDNPPPVPWCANRFEIPIFLAPESEVRWIGDFVRCVAWAWLDPDGDRYPRLSAMRTQSQRTDPGVCAQEAGRTGPQDNAQSDDKEEATKRRAREMLNHYFKGMEHMRADIPYPHPLPADIAPWHCYTSDGGHGILALPMALYMNPHLRNKNWVVPINVKTVLRRGYQMLDGFVVVDAPIGPWGVIEDQDSHEL